VNADSLDFEIITGKTSVSIIQYVEANHIDVLCMMSGKRTSFESMIKPSTAFELSKSLNCLLTAVPILFAKPPLSPELKA